MAKCPECNGKGHYWERSVEDRGAREKYECYLCRSTGYVTPETYAEWDLDRRRIESALQSKISETLGETRSLAASWEKYWLIRKPPRAPRAAEEDQKET